MIRPLLLGTFLGLASIGGANAQTAWVEVDDTVVFAPFGLTADAIDDMDVVDATGREIGEVEDVVGPNRTEATAVVIDLESEAGLPQGDADIIVPLGDLEVQGKNLRLPGDAAAIGNYPIHRD